MRVMRYTRPSDWGYGTALGLMSPGLMLYWEKISPSFVGKGGFAPVLRLSWAIGAAGTFLFAYSNTCRTCPNLTLPLSPFFRHCTSRTSYVLT